MAETITLATYNANSVRARLPLIQKWLEEYEPDVLCLQETKVRDEDFPSDGFRDVGYHVVFRGQKSYNGVAIASKEELQDVSRKFRDDEFDEQARYLAGTFRGVRIVNTYVPQGRAIDSDKYQYKLKWLSYLKQHFADIADDWERLVWMGDMNVAPDERDVSDADKKKKHVCFHKDARKALHDIMDLGFSDVFRKHVEEGEHYTFWDYRVPNALKRGLGWRIDLILAMGEFADKCKSVKIHRKYREMEKPSDHTFFCVHFELNDGE
ncbi:MAG: exodeoxyribonuclease III [Planctomycetota bacterium]|nr:exodeoxyribonuclease III [Planctomycetota bacterium]